VREKRIERWAYEKGNQESKGSGGWETTRGVMRSRVRRGIKGRGSKGGIRARENGGGKVVRRWWRRGKLQG